MKRILVATDLSGRSDRALQRAVALAREFGAELAVVHVIDESLPARVLARHEEAAKSAIEEQVCSLPAADGLDILIKVIRGHDYSEIIRCSTDYRADILILGVHRHGMPQMFKGTTAEKVVRFGSVPVLVVKDAVTRHYRRALVPADLSVHAQAAMSLAARLVPKGEVYLVHAAHRPFPAFLGRDTQNQLISNERARLSQALDRSIQELSTDLGDAAPRFELALREGDVRRVVREHVASLMPDLLAVGTHGRRGIAHAILGSVAEDLLANAPVDVAAVKAV